MTTQRLILIRHAKAAASGADDARRPLAHQGKRDAIAIGRWLREAGVTSGVAIVSTALRAVQTWTAAHQELGADITTMHDARLYENTVEDLLAVIREALEGTQTLVVVGHSPSIHALASDLDGGTGDRGPAHDMAGTFPPGGVAVLDVSGTWSELTVGAATLVRFAVPRG